MPIPYKEKYGWLTRLITAIAIYRSWLVSKFVLLVFAHHLEVCASTVMPGHHFLSINQITISKTRTTRSTLDLVP